MLGNRHLVVLSFSLCLIGIPAIGQELTGQDLELLKARSASENIVFGNLVKVDESRLSVQSGDTLRALRFSPETIVEIDGRPIRLRDLPPNARLRVLMDANDTEFARRILVLQDATGTAPATTPPASPAVIPPAPVVPTSPAPPSPSPAPLGVAVPGDSAPPVNVTTDPIPPVHLGAVFQTAPGGVLVRTVDPDSAALRSGLHVGDAIRKVGDQHVATTEGLFRMLHRLPAGERAPLTIVRNDREMTVDLLLPEDHRPYLLETNRRPEPPIPQPVKVITSGQLGWTLGLQAGTVQIVSLEPNGLAVASGMLLGDVIVAVHNERIARPEEVLQWIQIYGDSASVPITIRRNGVSVERGLALPMAETVAANHAPSANPLENPATDPPQPGSSLGGRSIEEQFQLLQRQQADQQQKLADLEARILQLQDEIRALRPVGNR